GVGGEGEKPSSPRVERSCERENVFARLEMVGEQSNCHEDPSSEAELLPRKVDHRPRRGVLEWNEQLAWDVVLDLALERTALQHGLRVEPDPVAVLCDDHYPARSELDHASALLQIASQR